MSKSLVIAEKPSVAADIARVLGKIPKKSLTHAHEPLTPNRIARY